MIRRTLITALALLLPLTLIGCLDESESSLKKWEKEEHPVDRMGAPNVAGQTAEINEMNKSSN